MSDTSTICAISTPPGIGGIAVIRLSGESAVMIADSLFDGGSTRQPLSELPGGIFRVGLLRDGDQAIDEVVVSLFRAPHSYTGEDVVEVSCHGSLYIQQKIVSMMIEKGARMAAPGEFTQRAFLNGKMDLSQA